MARLDNAFMNGELRSMLVEGEILHAAFYASYVPGGISGRLENRGAFVGLTDSHLLFIRLILFFHKMIETKIAHVGEKA